MDAKIKKVPDLVKVGKRGRFIIPAKLRKEMHIDAGSVFAVAHPKGDLLLLKKIEGSMLQDDIATLKEVEAAWKEIEAGDAVVSGKEEFLADLEKW